jgi:hypothetical protein
MRTILIAEHDAAFANELATELREGGYRVIVCPGPFPPVERCIRCDKGYCPLTEGADLLIYDPELTALDPTGNRYNLTIDSARAHPELPMLLAWPPGDPPDIGVLRAIRHEVPHAHVAATTPAALLRQVDGLLTERLASTPGD